MKFFEKTLALTRVELGQAKNQDDGTPVIQVSFETNKLMAFTDKDGNIASGEGTPQVSLKLKEKYTEYHEMPQKACERGFCHVIAFSQFFEMPQNRRISFSVHFLF